MKNNCVQASCREHSSLRKLTNHEFLRDSAQTYIDGIVDDEMSEEGGIWHVDNLALFAFTEHAGLCKNILSELH